MATTEYDKINYVDQNENWVKRYDNGFVDGEYYLVKLSNIVEKSICINDGNYTSIDIAPNVDLLAQYVLKSGSSEEAINKRMDFGIDPVVTPIANEGSIILQYNAKNHCFIDPVTGLAFEEFEDYQTSDYAMCNIDRFMEVFARAKEMPFFISSELSSEDIAKKSDKEDRELSEALLLKADECRFKLDNQFDKMIQAEQLIARYEETFEDVHDSESKTK